MIGNETKLLEDNIDTFLNKFIVDGGVESLKMRQVLSFYRLLKALST